MSCVENDVAAVGKLGVGLEHHLEGCAAMRAQHDGHRGADDDKLRKAA